MSSPDLSAPLFAALSSNAPIAAALAVYQGSAAVFTRRPVPANAGQPMIIAAGDVVHGDEDFLSDPVASIVRDVAVYGKQPAQYRAVESVGLMVRDLFHRQRGALTVPGWNVLDIRCAGPIIAPTDDDETVGRLVTLAIRLTPA